jgi:hypothetical protein
MVADPLALECFVGVVDFLLFEEVAELRVTAFDLLAGGPAMVSEIVVIA